MNPTETPLVGLAAWSGTGKTTLMIKLVSIFKERKIRVGVIKHAHHSFEIDYPGKDSYEIRKAGASQVLIGSKKRWALMVETEQEQPLEEHIKNLELDGLDLILVEGFKPEAIPKIELYRVSLGKELLSIQDGMIQDTTIIAIATDNADEMSAPIPILDINNPEQIADFIVERFLSRPQSILTEVNKQ